MPGGRTVYIGPVPTGVTPPCRDECLDLRRVWTVHRERRDHGKRDAIAIGARGSECIATALEVPREVLTVESMQGRRLHIAYGVGTRVVGRGLDPELFVRDQHVRERQINGLA